jgi:hypothetical protein
MSALAQENPKVETMPQAVKKTLELIETMPQETTEEILLAERKREADNALAIVMLEGFKPDEEFMERWNRLINDEITHEEFLVAIKSKYQLAGG